MRSDLACEVNQSFSPKEVRHSTWSEKVDILNANMKRVILWIRKKCLNPKIDHQESGIFSYLQETTFNCSELASEVLPLLPARHSRWGERGMALGTILHPSRPEYTKTPPDSSVCFYFLIEKSYKTLFCFFSHKNGEQIVYSIVLLNFVRKDQYLFYNFRLWLGNTTQD